MSVFRKRRRGEQPDPVAPADEIDQAEDLTDEDVDEYGEEYGDVDTEAGPRPDRPEGPYDISEVDDPAANGRVDLGGMWLPAHPRLEVRVEADQATDQVVAVTLVLGEGALQVQPFAAPRSEGIWDEVRAEIRAGITRDGGTVDEVDGPLGPELRTRVPVRAADGSQTVQPARFVGVDGPRWFLRGVITGRPAVEPDTDADLVALFRQVVVVRGDAPMAPRDPVPLRLPATPEERQAAQSGGGEDLKPFERGPEITEIR
jgi:hypothetical protein